MTYEDVCKVIEKEKFLVKKDGTNPTALEIFNYSRSGELIMISIWYEQAMALRKLRSLKSA